jgi:hypothetical protein
MPFDRKNTREEDTHAGRSLIVALARGDGGTA